MSRWGSSSRPRMSNNVVLGPGFESDFAKQRLVAANFEAKVDSPVARQSPGHPHTDVVLVREMPILVPTVVGHSDSYL